MHCASSLAVLAVVAGAAVSEDFDPFVASVPVAVLEFGPESDTDYNGVPDGWSRRTGPGFPKYVEARIDRREGHDAPGSLRFAPDGAPAVVYSAPLRIDERHLYVLEAFVRTQRLNSDAVVCSVSILDERMRRVGRHLTRAVSGTHRDWVRLRVGPINPTSGQRFLVLGCHLVRGTGMDLGGAAWIDDLRLGRAPFLSLAGREGRILRPSESTTFAVAAAGLEPDHPYQLSLSLRDASGQELARTDRELAVRSVSELEESAEPLATPWAVPGASRGFYRLEASLALEGRIVARRDAAFVVTDAMPAVDDSPFGWSAGEIPTEMDADDFAAAAVEAGVGRIKLPLWRDVSDRKAAGRAMEFVEQLGAREVTVVGVLDPPPDDLRRKFARDWKGAGEIFELDAEFWSPALLPAITRYGGRVRQWQLGQDGDMSFGVIKDLAGSVSAVRRAFDRVGRNTQVGFPWPADRPSPRPVNGFLSVLDADIGPLIDPEAESTEVWAAIRPLPVTGHEPEERAADLVRKLVKARGEGAAAVFHADVFDPERGLLRPDGSPTELFLAWRTAAVALRNARDLGPITLHGGSRSQAFATGHEAIIALWSDEPVTESFTPGGTPSVVDVWGQPVPVASDPATGRLEVAVGPSPVLVTGASVGLLRWQASATLEQATLRSQHGAQPLAIVGVNHFPEGVSGTVTLTPPTGWKVEPNTWTALRLGPGESFRLPCAVTLPPDAGLGEHEIELQFELQAERPYRFSIRRAVDVGLGDVEITVAAIPLPDGRLEIVQTLTNRTEPPEMLNFRCDLYVPNLQRQRQYVVKLAPGKDTKRYYVPNAAGLIGKELRIRAEQENGRRVLNYRWTVGEDG